MNDTHLIAFKSIVNFVNDLASEYGDKNKPLKLYRHIINKTQISHEKAILKHNEAFYEFCVENRDAILAKNHTQFTRKVIRYSERIFLDMSDIFALTDKDTEPVVWNHILTISAILDPAGRAKELLRKDAEQKGTVNEADFISNIISKVESSMNGTENGSNPLSAISNIMQSGIFTDLVQGMQDGLKSGKLDISKLLGTVQGMVGNMSKDGAIDPELAGMLSGMTNSIGKGDGKPPALDMSAMMGMMNSMMSNIMKPPQQGSQQGTKEEPKEEGPSDDNEHLD